MSREKLKVIHFEGELLPRWTDLLDLAARLCPVSDEVRDWFFRLANSSGVDDASVVAVHCELLRTSLREQHVAIASELKREQKDGQAEHILGAWGYALDTMIQTANSQTRKTCSWIVEGVGDNCVDGSEGGTVTLRRV
jgi:hypothetical protein